MRVFVLNCLRMDNCLLCVKGSVDRMNERTFQLLHARSFLG